MYACLSTGIYRNNWNISQNSTVDGEQLLGVSEPEYMKQDLKNVTELKQPMVINYCMRSAWRRRRSTWNMSQHWNTNGHKLLGMFQLTWIRETFEACRTTETLHVYKRLHVLDMEWMKKALEACDITEALVENTDYVWAGMGTEASESFHSTEH